MSNRKSTSDASSRSSDGSIDTRSSRFSIFSRASKPNLERRSTVDTADMQRGNPAFVQYLEMQAEKGFSEPFIHVNRMVVFAERLAEEYNLTVPDNLLSNSYQAVYMQSAAIKTFINYCKKQKKEHEEMISGMPTHTDTGTPVHMIFRYDLQKALADTIEHHSKKGAGFIKIDADKITEKVESFTDQCWNAWELAQTQAEQARVEAREKAAETQRKLAEAERKLKEEAEAESRKKRSYSRAHTKARNKIQAAAKRAALQARTAKGQTTMVDVVNAATTQKPSVVISNTTQATAGGISKDRIAKALDLEYAHHSTSDRLLDVVVQAYNELPKKGGYREAFMAYVKSPVKNKSLDDFITSTHKKNKKAMRAMRTAEITTMLTKAWDIELTCVGRANMDRNQALHNVEANFVGRKEDRRARQKIFSSVCLQNPSINSKCSATDNLRAIIADEFSNIPKPGADNKFRA